MKDKTVFYCLSGEGFGHASRSETIINFLIENGYKVTIFTYGKSIDFLSEVFGKNTNVLEVVEITGSRFEFKNGEFKFWKTFFKELRHIPGFVLRNPTLFIKRLAKYEPELIFVDIEPIGFNIGKIFGIPVVTVENNTYAVKVKLSDHIKQFVRRKVSYKFTILFLKFSGTKNFITTFAKDRNLKEKYQKNTSFVAPILRNSVREKSPKIEDFVLIYQTTDTTLSIIKEELLKIDEKFVIYGFNREEKLENITFKKTDQSGFVKDLASCKAFIANGGFSAISEAIYFKKPIFSVPTKGQFEQELNAMLVKEMNFGGWSPDFDVNKIKKFLQNLESYRDSLSQTNFDPDEIFKKLKTEVLDAKDLKSGIRYKIFKRLTKIFKKN